MVASPSQNRFPNRPYRIETTPAATCLRAMSARSGGGHGGLVRLDHPLARRSTQGHVSSQRRRVCWTSFDAWHRGAAFPLPHAAEFSSGEHPPARPRIAARPPKQRGPPRRLGRHPTAEIPCSAPTHRKSLRQSCQQSTRRRRSLPRRAKRTATIASRNRPNPRPTTESTRTFHSRRGASTYTPFGVHLLANHKVTGECGNLSYGRGTSFGPGACHHRLRETQL
jgi:hypothetical protein